jgi:hypothetical protein
MFVEYIYIYIYINIYKQYNFETARRNTLKLKYFIPIKKTKWNWQPYDLSSESSLRPSRKWSISVVQDGFVLSLWLSWPSKNFWQTFHRMFENLRIFIFQYIFYFKFYFYKKIFLVLINKKRYENIKKII